MTVLPDIQLVLRPGIVEMQWGNPDPALLPVDVIARAADLALRRIGRVLRIEQPTPDAVAQRAHTLGRRGGFIIARVTALHIA